jgi:arylsulfatase
MFNLRMDPYERADITSNSYWEWLIRHAFLAVPSQAIAAQFLATFKDYPPRQRPAAFNLDEVVSNMLKPGGS